MRTDSLIIAQETNLLMLVTKAEEIQPHSLQLSIQDKKAIQVLMTSLKEKED